MTQELYDLKDPLLTATLWGGGDYCERKYGHRFGGYLQAGIERESRALFAYFCRRVFGIFRLPGTDDMENCTDTFWALAENGVFEEDVEKACSALREMAAFVQDRLYHSERCHDGKVTLTRNIRAYELSKSFISEESGEDRTVKLFSNVFTSFSHERRETGRYGCNYNLQIDVPVEDIVYYDSLVTKPGSLRCDHSAADDEYEVLVLCRNASGFRDVKESDFVAHDGKTIEEAICKRILEPDTRRPVFQPCFERLAPCACDDWLTRYVIERNVKRLKREWPEYFPKTGE